MTYLGERGRGVCRVRQERGAFQAASGELRVRNDVHLAGAGPLLGDEEGGGHGEGDLGDHCVGMLPAKVGKVDGGGSKLEKVGEGEFDLRDHRIASARWGGASACTLGSWG